MPLRQEIPRPGYEHYFPYPSSLFALSHAQRAGLPVLGLLACISVLSTSIIIGLLTFRMLNGLRYREGDVCRNELLIFVYNLLWADFWQAFSFLFSIHWHMKGMILAPTSACWTQAWLLHLGDVASGFFVLAIAVHTYVRINRINRLVFSYPAILTALVAIWAFSVLLASLAPMIRGGDAFVRAGSWCWINRRYEDDRLYLHYLWIFIVQAATIIAYGLIAARLLVHRREMNALNMTGHVRSRLDRSLLYMALYPTVYLACTLPLAVGRMISMARGQPLSDAYMIMAGSLITSCGWLDAIMYTATRNVLKSGSMPASPVREAQEASFSHDRATGPTSGSSNEGGFTFAELTASSSTGTRSISNNLSTIQESSRVSLRPSETGDAVQAWRALYGEDSHPITHIVHITGGATDPVGQGLHDKQVREMLRGERRPVAWGLNNWQPPLLFAGPPHTGSTDRLHNSPSNPQPGFFTRARSLLRSPRTSRDMNVEGLELGPTRFSSRPRPLSGASFVSRLSVAPSSGGMSAIAAAVLPPSNSEHVSFGRVLSRAVQVTTPPQESPIGICAVGDGQQPPRTSRTFSAG